MRTDAQFGQSRGHKRLDVADIYFPAVRVRIYCGFLRYHVTAHRRGAGYGQVGVRARRGSGGELVARVLVCLFLPSAVSGGAVDASSGSAAFFALCTADPLAWFAADAVPAFSFIPHVARCGKGGRRRKNILSAA